MSKEQICEVKNCKVEFRRSESNDVSYFSVYFFPPESKYGYGEGEFCSLKCPQEWANRKVDEVYGEVKA